MEPDPAASTGTDGYSVHTRSLWRFADTMIFSADTVDAVKQSTPRFDGWNLIPMGGIPISGLLFIGRFNAITDLWRDCADTLANLIKTDSAKIATAARRYQAAEEAGTIKTV